MTDLLADSLTLTGRPRWTASLRRATWLLLCNDVNCTNVFTTGAVFYSHRDCCRPLSSTVAVSGSHQRRGQRGPAELRHRNCLPSAGNFNIDGLGRSNRGELRGHRALTAPH